MSCGTTPPVQRDAAPLTLFPAPTCNSETRQRTDPLNVPITDAELEVNKDRLRAIAENPTLVNVIRRRLENAEHFDETVGTKEPLMAAT